MPRAVRTLFVSIFLIAITIAIPSVFAQQAQDPGNPAVPQKLDKEAKRKMKRTLKELDSAYRQWLTEDVTYIISPDERNAFLQLDTNEEREQFIEQFGCGAAAIPTFRRTTLRKSITAGLLTPTNTMPPASRDGGPIAGACTSCGARRMKLNRTRQAALTTGPWKRAVARRQLIRGKRGAGAIWKASAKILFLNSSIPAVRVNIT